MPELTKAQREAIEWAAWRLKPVIGDEAQAHRDELLSILATHPTETDGSWCQSCGDGLTAHDPGICGNCYAMKYRDRCPAAEAPTAKLEHIGWQMRHVDATPSLWFNAEHGTYEKHKDAPGTAWRKLYAEEEQ